MSALPDPGRSAGRSRLPGRASSLAVLVIVWMSLPTLGFAQIPVVDAGAFSANLTGYVRSLAGIHDAGYEIPGGDRRSGFHGGVVRLKWRARWAEGLVLDVHNRAQVTVSSTEAGFGSAVAGFGVSADPGRLVDLESVWIDQERLRAWHDVDRLALTAYTSRADITIGRQAITWGISLLFPVADLWAQFSPFELDTEEKPGVDAVRILAYPTPGLEFDAVVADRGSLDDVSAGVRATWSLSSADVHVAGGRLWNEAIFGGGIAWLFDTWKLRAEALVARDLDRDRWLDPRTTLGIDRLGSRWSVSAEYHFNGLGASGPEGYLDRLQSPSFARGESYFLGRHYIGGLAAWAVDEQQRVRLAGTLLVNLGDPSGAFLPAVVWDLGQSTNLSLGALLALGDEPTFPGLLPVLGSEYGTYGNLGYAQMSVYF